MSEQFHGTTASLPEEIPTVNAVEFAAAMTLGWERQTNRIIQALVLLTGLSVFVVSGINWGVQYRLSRSALLLESTRANVVQTQLMLKNMMEDRRTDEARFRTLMAAVSAVAQRAEQFRQERSKR